MENRFAVSYIPNITVVVSISPHKIMHNHSLIVFKFQLIVKAENTQCGSVCVYHTWDVMFLLCFVYFLPIVVCSEIWATGCVCVECRRKTAASVGRQSKQQQEGTEQGQEGGEGGGWGRPRGSKSRSLTNTDPPWGWRKYEYGWHNQKEETVKRLWF